MNKRVFLAVLAAGVAFLCAGPSIAHAQENCGGVEQPPCPKKPPNHTTGEPPAIRFVLTVNVSGNGHVGGSGISCPSDCGATYDEHAVVVLVPLAAPGWRFVGWSGDCHGRGICVVTMDADRSAGATFEPANVPPDEIGQENDPPDGKGTAGGNTEVTLGFDCYSNDELWLDELFLVVLRGEGGEGGIADFAALLTGGSPRTDVALAFLQSIEYRTLLVQTWYQAFLHRSPSAEEIALWLGQLTGATDEQVEGGILGSDEYYNTRGGGTNAGFVEALYHDLLGRDPTSAEQAQLDAAFGAGATRIDVALAVLKSVEYRTRLIQSWFQAYLHRAPTDVELNLFLQQFAAGATDEQLLAQLFGSQEFYDAVGDYKATIDWGDGTTSTVEVLHTRGGKVCVVDGSHVFQNPEDIPITVEVTDSDGNTQTFDGVLHIVLAPPPPPGKENVQPFGTVLIKVNGKFVPLTTFRVIAVGSILDTTNGRVRLTSHDGATGFFFEGQFQIQQVFITVNGQKKLVTLLVLTGPEDVCGSRTTAGVGAKPKHKPVRHLWGNAKGAFRTKGKYASATVRGTQWETIDYCDGTTVVVRVGIVDVLDLVRNLHHFVSAGHSFFSPAP